MHVSCLHTATLIMQDYCITNWRTRACELPVYGNLDHAGLLHHQLEEPSTLFHRCLAAVWHVPRHTRYIRKRSTERQAVGGVCTRRVAGNIFCMSGYKDHPQSELAKGHVHATRQVSLCAPAPACACQLNNQCAAGVDAPHVAAAQMPLLQACPTLLQCSTPLGLLCSSAGAYGPTPRRLLLVKSLLLRFDLLGRILKHLLRILYCPSRLLAHLMHKSDGYWSSSSFDMLLHATPKHSSAEPQLSAVPGGSTPSWRPRLTPCCPR